MITLAAGFGDYGFLLVMLIFGLINWLASKIKEGKPGPPPRPIARAPQPRDTAPQTRTPEDERMRRFLEALGMPADEPPRPTPMAPPPPRPAPVVRRPAPVVRRAAPPPLPTREHSLEEADTTAEPVERIHLRELRTAEVPEFQTVSSRVSADPSKEYATVSSRISAVPTLAPVADPTRAPHGGEALSGALFTALRAPASLRQALVLREILGPPRSLQG